MKMVRKLSNNLKTGLVALAMLVSMAFVGGCTVSVDGLGDVARWVDDVLNSYYYGYGCPSCGDVIIEYDD
jgi:hypothetical protein